MIRHSLKSSSDWAVILKALADETRLKIINELLNRETSVNKLANTLGMEQYNISKHLKILESNGLIKKRKEGIHRIYNVTDEFKSRLSDDKELELGCCKFKFGYIKE